MKTVNLRDFLETLSLRSAKDFSGLWIDEYLNSIQFEEDTFLPFTHFCEENHARNLVFKNEFFELLVLAWLPGQRTPIHDHAKQRCWMILDMGTLTVKNYQPIENGKLPKALGEVQTVHAGKKIYIDDDRGIHSITNASKLPAVSVHLYAGPIETCQVFDEGKKIFVQKKLSYLTTPIWNDDWTVDTTDICPPEISGF